MALDKKDSGSGTPTEVKGMVKTPVIDWITRPCLIPFFVGSLRCNIVKFIVAGVRWSVVRLYGQRPERHNAQNEPRNKR